MTIKEKLQVKNAASVYQFSTIFHLPSLQKATLSYIERCFTIVSDTESFVHLNFTSLSKVLTRSGLLITSEIEVFKAADKWLDHNIKERSKYAKVVY